MKATVVSHRSFYGNYGKRIIDLLITIPALLVLSLLLLAIAVVLCACLRGPALFRQLRLGYQVRPFSIYKFRTMADTRDARGELLPDAERLMPLGRFLRSTSLDELPELINVLRGEMSLVGPRPLLTQYLSRYTPEQMRRHDILPGVTGWAQVNGRNMPTWEETFALDVWYVDHQSLSLDLRIMALTVWKVLTREGINQPGQATRTEFRGTASE